jgi:thiosulfate reductase cytochrome b subunit
MKIYVYTGFQRFWHWTQNTLIFLLAFTGFEVHGTYRILGFERAVMLHNTAAYGLLALIAFAIFYHFTTGQWRQYLPTRENLGKALRYYAYGIFRNEPHPFRKTEISRLNPEQRIAYASLKLILFPGMVITGLAYLLYNRWSGFDLGFIDLNLVAFIHTLGALGFIAFVIGHVYLTTMGYTIFGHIKAMITGYEDVPEEHAHEYEDYDVVVETGSD